MKLAKRLLLMIVTMMVLNGTGPGFAVKNGIAAEGEVIVFAAASTTNAVTEIGDLFAAGGFGQITTSFASSSTLAKQIASGAPADVFLSANIKWMDFLEEKGAVEKTSRFDLLGNRIVLIAPAQSSVQTLEVKRGLDLAALLGRGGRLSMGDPEHVPAGIYGKQAMEGLGLWEQVKDRLAPMKDVRAALVMVERAEVPLGLVYSTDAAVSEKVRTVGIFPEESHPPIVYPVAAVAGQRTDAAAKFLNFLKTQEAQAVFKKYGFDVR